jgi:flagellar assembly protein FliH
MSSRILPPDPERQLRQVAWPQVAGKPGPADSDAPAAEFGRRAEELRRECERRVGEARSAAFEEGAGQARAEAAAGLQAVVERMARSVEEMATLRARLRREAEGDLIRLALAIARRVLNRELAVDPEAMHGLILGALEKLQSHEISRVRVHPDLAAMLRESLRRVAAHQSAEVVADTSRERGDLVFETTRGNLDVSVEGQLQEIERGLADRLRRSS